MPENVWDYPRPPELVPCGRHVHVEAGGVVIAESSAALRILETSPAAPAPRGRTATRCAGTGR